jgi:hypothetical protein
VITILALSVIAAGLASTRRFVWHVLKTSRRVDADIAFMQAMPSRMDERNA